MSTTTMTTTSPADKATEAVDQALARAQAAAQAKRFGEAAGICNDVLAAAPDNAPALALLGMIAAHTNDPERGITLLERAVTLRPGVASWYANLSALYRMVYRMQDALRVRPGGDPARSAERRPPGQSVAGVHRRGRPRARHRLPAARARAEARPRRRPSGARPEPAGDGRFRARLAGIRVAQPDRGRQGHAAEDDLGAWNGMRIPNGRLLMVGDQGYGDTIQFARYIPLIADRCQELILGCSAEMGPLLASIPGVKQVLPSLDRRARPRRALPAVQRAGPVAHDARRRSRRKVPYLFADPARVAAWRERLDAQSARRRAAHRPGLDRPADASQRSPPFAAAGAPGAARRRRPRQLRVAAEADAGSAT